MSRGEIIALLVGGLAAGASLVNAAVSAFNAWRDNRGLKICPTPDPWQEDLREARYGCSLTMEVWNYARSPNMLAEASCLLDAKKHPCTYVPADLLREPIAGFSCRKWSLALEAGQMPPDFAAVEIVIVPVRGRKRKFRFSKAEILPPF